LGRQAGRLSGRQAEWTQEKKLIGREADAETGKFMQLFSTKKVSTQSVKTTWGFSVICALDEILRLMKSASSKI
jgi:hypothetical protein